MCAISAVGHLWLSFSQQPKLIQPSLYIRTINHVPSTRVPKIRAHLQTLWEIFKVKNAFPFTRDNKHEYFSRGRAQLFSQVFLSEPRRAFSVDLAN